MREKGVLSDISPPDPSRTRRDVAQSVGGGGAGWTTSRWFARPVPTNSPKPGAYFIELCAHDKGELERRRELRSRLEASDRRDTEEGRLREAPDRSHIFNDHTASRLGRIERLIEGLQKSLAETGAGRVSARPSDSRLYVSLSTDKDAPRLPVGDIRVYDAIERIATGAKLQLGASIGKDGPALINGFTEKEYDYRVKVAGFLKSYVTRAPA